MMIESAWERNLRKKTYKCNQILELVSKFT